jgi:hypothetical protein
MFGSHHDRQNQSVGIDQKMPLAAIDVLATLATLGSPLPGGFQTRAIDATCRGFGGHPWRLRPPARNAFVPFFQTLARHHR